MPNGNGHSNDPIPVMDLQAAASVPLKPPRRRKRSSRLIPLALFVLTVLSTMLIGAHYARAYDAGHAPFSPDDDFFPPIFSEPGLLLTGLPFSFTLMSILLAHELGHYFACRYYRISATVPYFIPFPSIIGTLGAFIRIRSPIVNRKALFDVGLSGPVVGFLFALPALAIGYHAPPRRTPEWHALALVDQALHGGRAGRIYRQLVLEKQVAVDSEGGIHYPLGDVFDYNGPMLMTTRILHKPEFSAEQTIAEFDAVIGEVQEQGIAAGELDQVKVKFRSDYYSSLEGGLGGYIPRFGLMHYAACFTLFDGDPTLVNTILDGFLAVTPEQTRAAAQKYLVPANRAIVIRARSAAAAQTGGA